MNFYEHGQGKKCKKFTFWSAFLFDFVLSNRFFPYVKCVQELKTISDINEIKGSDSLKHQKCFPHYLVNLAESP